MSLKIVIHDEARYDAIDIAYSIAENSLQASYEFVEEIDRAFARLAEMPGIGVIRTYNNSKYKGMRMSPIPNFPKYLIFYRPTETDLEILRVLHSARDIESLFLPDEET